MLAQVKKLAGGDVAGRLGAWWSGRDYVPPVEGEGAPARFLDLMQAGKGGVFLLSRLGMSRKFMPLAKECRKK